MRPRGGHTVGPMARPRPTPRTTGRERPRATRRAGPPATGPGRASRRGLAGRPARPGRPSRLGPAGRAAAACPPPLLAVGAGELSLLLLVLVAVVVPVAAIAFARSGKGLEELGRGRFAVDFDEGADEDRGDEVRQMVEARAWRRESRGEDPGDVEAEIDRLLALDPGAPVEPVATERSPGLSGLAGPGGDDGGAPGPDDDLGGLREEIRQIVVANNERRQRRGEPPLEVEAEVERRLRELT